MEQFFFLLFGPSRRPRNNSGSSSALFGFFSTSRVKVIGGSTAKEVLVLAQQSFCDTSKTQEEFFFLFSNFAS